MAEDPSREREQAAAMLADASARVVRTVDGFHGDDWTAPSLLPDWTRRHLVAHLSLNAEAMSGVLRGLVADTGEASEGPPPMYASDDQRADDIAELATADPGDVRARLLAAITLLQESVAALPDAAWETRVERTPGGRTMRAGAFPGMRWRELEIHHVDLDAGYTRAHWDLAFSEHLVGAMTKRFRPDEPFAVRPLDSGRTWVVGDAEADDDPAVVTGPCADLAWWLTGRSVPDTVSCSRGELPSIEGW